MIAKRREDRLIFDMQTALADRLATRASRPPRFAAGARQNTPLGRQQTQRSGAAIFVRSSEMLMKPTTGPPRPWPSSIRSCCSTSKSA